MISRALRRGCGYAVAGCLCFLLTGCAGWAGSSGGDTPPVPVTSTAAARILDQGTFGPTTSSIQHVQQVGFNIFLNEQFNTPATLVADIPNPNPVQCNQFTTAQRNCAQSAWLQIALTGNDQLRQRVAYALSEIWVTSTLEIDGRAMTPYLNLLAKDAFTNYRTIMQDVTLSPAMGNYLNMLNSNLPENGEIANENYARELMQLFTTGVYLLNEDGSLQLDSNGNPIPVYTEDQVQAFARVYTGWTYANSDGSAPSTFPNETKNYDSPMAAVESHHDMQAKAILSGITLPADKPPRMICRMHSTISLIIPMWVRLFASNSFSIWFRARRVQPMWSGWQRFLRTMAVGCGATCRR